MDRFDRLQCALPAPPPCHYPPSPTRVKQGEKEEGNGLRIGGSISAPRPPDRRPPPPSKLHCSLDRSENIPSSLGFRICSEYLGEDCLSFAYWIPTPQSWPYPVLQLFKIEKKTLVWSSLVLHALATNGTHIQSGKKSFVLNHEEEEESDTNHDLKKHPGVLLNFWKTLSAPFKENSWLCLGTKVWATRENNWQKLRRLCGSILKVSRLRKKMSYQGSYELMVGNPAAFQSIQGNMLKRWD